MSDKPRHLDLARDHGLTVEWTDGTTSFYPVPYLRRMSPSAEARQLREELASNPLAVLPASAGQDGPLRAEGAELIGNYAIRIRFSDGHDTGLYSWQYLREIDPGRSSPEPGAT
ncbi:MAG: gamma-butyrobetaine hydroxylase-like domain-containing protein [Planctomycetota bacterium]